MVTLTSNTLNESNCRRKDCDFDAIKNVFDYLIIICSVYPEVCSKRENKKIWQFDASTHHTQLKLNKRKKIFNVNDACWHTEYLSIQHVVNIRGIYIWIYELRMIERKRREKRKKWNIQNFVYFLFTFVGFCIFQQTLSTLTLMRVSSSVNTGVSIRYNRENMKCRPLLAHNCYTIHEFEKKNQLERQIITHSLFLYFILQLILPVLTDLCTRR